MLLLSRDCILTLGAIRILFLRSWRSAHSSASAVIADASDVDVVDDGLLVHVVNLNGIYIINIAVVVEVATSPVATLITAAAVTVAVVDAAVESNLRAPVAGVPLIETAAPSPISGSPKTANKGGHDPRSGNPVIAAVLGVSPIAGCPNISGGGAQWLTVNRQRRRCDVDGYKNSGEGRCRQD